MRLPPTAVGLFCRFADDDAQPAQLPLLKTSVTVHVKDMCCHTVTEQWFANTHSSMPTEEAIYCFPLDSKAAVAAFESEVDGIVSKAEVCEKAQAQHEFEEAVRSGGSAQLLLQETPDIFQSKIGGLAPGKLIKIRTTTVAICKAVEGAVEVFVPAKVAPRYTPPGSDPKGVLAQRCIDGHLPAAPLEISVTCEMASTVVDLTSTTHTIAVEKQHAEATEAAGGAAAPSAATSASARLSPGAATFLERDFQLLITTADPHAPRVLLENNPVTKTTACAVTFVPQLAFADCKCEFVFVVDRSGSMSGAGIASAKAAVNLFLRSLPEDCYFNIVGFGTRHETLFKASAKLSAKSLATATRHVQHEMEANLGGTNLLSPLSDVLGAASPAPAYARQVFVLTDGQVSNTAQVVTAVGRARTARCFALGLGNGCSRDLVDGIARAGLGAADYALQQGNQLERVVIAQLKKAMQPALTDTRISWNQLVKDATSDADADAARAAQAAQAEAATTTHGANSLLSYISPKAVAAKAKATIAPAVCQAPWTVPPIFSGEQFTIFAVFDSEDDAAEAAATALEAISVTSQTPDGPLTLELPITVCSGGSTLIHALAARATIQDLEDGKSSYFHRDGKVPTPLDVKAEIVRLGTAHGLVSQHTSYIATQPPAPQEDVRSRGRRRTAAASGGGSVYGGGVGGGERFRCLSSARNVQPGHQQLSAVQQAMHMNLSESLDRSSSLDHLESKSTDLSQLCKPFYKKSTAAKGSFSLGGLFSSFSNPFASKSAPVAFLRDAPVASQSAPVAFLRDAPNSAARAAARVDTLQQLVLLQEFNGAFQMSAALAHAVGRPLAELTAAADAFGATLHNAALADARSWFAVAAALAFLREKLAERKAEWELVELKSLKWLRQQGHTAGYKTFEATVCNAAALAISG